jgi:hypothetical protein
MPIRHKAFRSRPADEARSAGDEDAHQAALFSESKFGLIGIGIALAVHRLEVSA